MMWHHCFLPGRFDGYTISFFPFTVDQVTSFATFGKICISLFAFVSGYGLYQSFAKYNENKNAKATRWYFERYIKSYSDYWFVVVAVWIVTLILNQRPVKIYFKSGKACGIVYMLFDLLGLAKLFGTPSMIATWWYMSAYLVYIILTPVLIGILKKYGPVCLLGILIVIPRITGGYPGGTHFLSFLPAYTMGLIFCQYKVFETIDRLCFDNKRNTVVMICFFFLTSIAAGYLSVKLPVNNFWDITRGLFPSLYIVFIYLSFARVSGIRHVLCVLGRHSANIYLIHNFIRITYCSDFIYSCGHFLTIILVLLLSSLLCSCIIELTKQVLHYSVLTDRLLKLDMAHTRSPQ